MISLLKKEVQSTFWVLTALLFIAVFMFLPPLLVNWLVGPGNVVGFIGWNVVWLIFRAGVNKYV